jgi:hypothetical protein
MGRSTTGRGRACVVSFGAPAALLGSTSQAGLLQAMCDHVVSVDRPVLALVQL